MGEVKQLHVLTRYFTVMNLNEMDADGVYLVINFIE